jgi:phosphopentomutase
MARAVILLLDSFGIGAAKDAKSYGDEGANTFGHVAEFRIRTKQPLQIPNLTRLGLTLAAGQSDKNLRSLFEIPKNITAKYGYAVEISHGKDTPSGHWEIAGVPVLFDWGYFSPDYPSFPEGLVSQFVTLGEIPGILGNRHASGTQIIEELGDEHIKTGKPIVYTSGDSVFQIAAHEEIFGLDRLYQLCEIARKLVDPYRIGRVIARPFLGSDQKYYRTGNRRDYSMPPPAPTLLDRLKSSGGNVIAIGKTADIFAHRGINQTIKANGTRALFSATLSALQTAPDRSLIFTNFVDFDTVYGHRRDVAGYAKELELFDTLLPSLEQQLQPDDIVIITADHGCDPTWKGTDHTREHIPVLVFGPSLKSENLGERTTFADIGQSLAIHFGLESLEYGKSFL